MMSNLIDTSLEWLKSFIGGLERVLDKSPYLMFVYIGAVFVVISLMSKNAFDKIWVFFIYAVGGIMWRYFEHDFEYRLKENYEKSKYYKDLRLVITIVYQAGNFILFGILLHYLNFV